jgi:hypothetical protein
MIEFISQNLMAVLFFLIISSVILFAASFWHLNFKHLHRNVIASVSAVMGIILVFCYAPLIDQLIVNFGQEVIILHILLMGAFFIVTIIFSAFVKRSVPSVFQIVGPFVFIGGYFLLLA